MRHVIRDGGSNASRHAHRRTERTRLAALAATFLLLVAGVLVTAPGLMTASATSSNKPAYENDKGGDDNGHDGDNGDDNGDHGDDGDDHGDDGDDHEGHHHEDDECTNDDGDQGEHEDDDETSSSVDEDENEDQDEAEGDDEAENETDNTYESDKFMATTADAKGDDSEGETSTSVEDEDDDDDETSSTVEGDDDDDNDDDEGDDECPAPDVTTIEAYKVLGDSHGGTMAPEEFTLFLDGVEIPQGVDTDVAPGEHTITETDVFGYELDFILCTDRMTHDQVSLDGVVSIATGQQISCEVVNNEIPPSITLHKEFIKDDGGMAEPQDFTFTVTSESLGTQTVAHDQDEDPFTDIMANEPLTVAEVQDNVGYTVASIDCTSDVDGVITKTSVEGEDSLELVPVLGEKIDCIITNDDVAPTVTINKIVHGGNKAAGQFQMLLDDAPVTQGDPHPVTANTLVTVSEVEDTNYVSTTECVDDIDGEITGNEFEVVEGHNVECTITNTLKDPDGAVDLSITKTDNGLDQIAGGDSFDYTITVDNLGPGDPTGPVTVTDELPVGLTFVSFPANCDQLDQTLTCDIDPADMQVDDDPVVLTVTVSADADAASGTYTNLALVDTPQDPAPEVATCDSDSNNVACETTTIHRQASITVDKEASVAQVSPGQSFSYTLEVTNPGPSTFLANLKLTDDLIDDLHLDSVDPGAEWSCNTVDPVVCTYNANLDPGVTTSVVTLHVTLSNGFLGSTVPNSATAIAIVDPPAAPAISAEATTSDPGTVVTATDDVITPVVRNADLAIVKTVSQPTVVAGGQFNWILDVTNNGPNAATDVVISDTVPAQFVVVAPFPPVGVTCTNTTTAVQCTAPSLAPGASLHIVIQVTTVNGATLGIATNTATVSTTSTDPNPANNSDSESIDVVASASSPPTAPPSVGAGAPTPQLPRTGNSPLGGPLTLASLLVAGGVFSLVIARRRRAAAAQ
jgi:uncharacterized repeat protein (TIGR01451 family)